MSMTTGHKCDFLSAFRVIDKNLQLEDVENEMLNLISLLFSLL